MEARSRRRAPRRYKSSSTSWYQLATFVIALTAILLFYSQMSSGLSGCFFNLSGPVTAPEKPRYPTPERRRMPSVNDQAPVSPTPVTPTPPPSSKDLVNTPPDVVEPTPTIPGRRDPPHHE
ncbi:MAG: hypothetical protein KC609_16280 [Myxococcales bacterium]|nr:hypothetical protein [Myxococcales bacterium]